MNEKKDLSDEEYETHFKNALSNYIPVLGIIDEIYEKYPPDMRNEKFPVGWTDILELYGCYLKELKDRQFDLETERRLLKELFVDHSSQWIWGNRLRLVAERIYIHDFF
jgi:hypothetical protein